MLLPLATLLAYIASDARHKQEQRDRARDLLRKLNSKFCTAIAVSADWGIICQWFLRLFDVADHDIAKSRMEIDCMIETLDAVFMQGKVFDAVLQAPASGGGGAPASGSGGAPASGGDRDEPLPTIPAESANSTIAVKPGFITEKVVRDLRKRYVFYASGTPVLLWGEPLAADKLEILERLQNVAALTKQRLQADFPRDDIRSALSVFDRRKQRIGFARLPSAEVRREVLRGVRMLAESLGVDPVGATLQYNDVSAWMLAQSEPGQPLAACSNQDA